MDRSLLAAGLVLAALPLAGAAQEAPAPGCYVEVARLMDDPPAGIGEIGAAIREIDTRLRPQVEAINEIKAQIARIEQRRAAEAPVAEPGGLEDEASAPLPAIAPDPDAEELRRLQTDLEAKQDQLKADYAAQQRALVGPVQARVSERAQAFAAQRGCAELKMARAPDLAALAAAGAQNVTGEFVNWYLANPPG